MRNARLVTDTMDRMTIDELVMKMLDQHRESYAYHLVKELDVSSEKEHALLYAYAVSQKEWYIKQHPPYAWNFANGCSH